MFISSIVWSYSKDLLHHAALKIHLVVGKFQEFVFLVLLVKNEKFGFFHRMHNN